MEDKKLYALLSSSKYTGEGVIVQCSFNKKELEDIKEYIETHTKYFTPILRVIEVDEFAVEWYWPPN